MNWPTQWLSGFESGGVFILLVLLLTVSMRLFYARRKRAYFTLLFSVVLLMSEYGLRMYMAQNVSNGAEWIHFWIHVLQISAFITINMGIYQLYNRSSRRQNILYWCLIALTGWIAWFERPLAPAEPESFLIMDLYLLLLILCAFYWIIRFIGQTVKYHFGLLAYLVMHLSHLGNRYALSQPHPLLQAAEEVLPVVFLFILFLFVFDRVVELLQAVYFSSITDGLTRLYNRVFFVRRLTQYLQRGHKVSVIFCDIDNFKKLNDTKGHQAGDDALRNVADILREQVEDIGIAGRYGGEELVAMITDPRVRPGEVAESIRSRVERETIVTVSVGFSVSGKGTDGETLLKQADEAMYYSKTNGKNQVTSYQQMKRAERKAKTVAGGTP